MSKRFVRGFVLGVVVVAAGMTPYVTNAAPSPSVDVGVAVGSGFVIEPPMAHYLRNLDQREQREQIRDWAVIATIAKLGATPAQAAAATYELPPARLPYFDELYNFEYGRGRRAYLGKRVLLFRDGDDPDPQATIGRLADRVRMENGEIPPKVEIYLVHDQRDEGTIRVERAADVAGSKLFSAAYGYVEGTADSVGGLGAWLGKTDDLAFARIDHGHVTLGGRRFAHTPALGLTTEDVAALYQAHTQLGGPHAAARARFASLSPDTRAAAEHLVALIEAHAPDEDIKKAAAALSGKVPPGMRDAVGGAIGALIRPVQSPGFSLDPQWLPDPGSPEHPLMLSKLRAFAADPCAALADIAKRADELERAEPDDTRRTALARSALVVRADLSAIVCPTLERVVSPLHALASKVALAKPDAWESELVGHYRLIERWRNSSPQNPSSRADNSVRRKVGLLSNASRDHASWIAYLHGAPSGRAPLSRIPEVSHLVESPPLLVLGEHSEEPRIRALEIATEALESYENESKAQCARYVGTEGTSVGMTMFYTDLLAKLWESTDYGLSAPIVAVPGFPSKPRIDLPPEFLADAQKNPGTRIWFGARASGVSKTRRGKSSSFYFDHAFSRIYAAGSNPANPGMEVRPNESSRRAIGWWDRHFDDVASYEPEYQRLNQIMKWALVTAALSESNTAPYLGSMRVQRGWKFSDWQQANRARLRFSESLPALKSSLSDRECLPLLTSYSFASMGRVGWTIAGGVDSVPATGLAKVPVPEPSLPLGARKPYVSNLAGDSAGTAVRAHPTVSGEAVEFVDPPSVRMLTSGGDVPLGTPKVAYKAGSTPRTFEIDAGAGPRSIGRLEAEANSTQVKLRWTEGEVELERYNAPTVPDRLAAADKLAAKGDLITAARSYQTSAEARPVAAIELARETVVKAAQRNPRAVLQAVKQLEDTGAQLLPESRQAVVNAMSEVGSPRVAAHVARAFNEGLPLANKYGSLTVERGRITVTRDFAQLPVTKLSTKAPTNLSDCDVYLDTRLLVGREGLVPDVGGPAARWQRMPNVTVEEMDGSSIGARPDRIVTGTTTKTTFDHVAPSTRSTPRTTEPSHMIFIRSTPECDRDHKTATTDDDCRERSDQR